MNKQKASIALVMVFGGLALLFNNCSNVGFSEVPVNSVVESSPADDGEPAPDTPALVAPVSTLTPADQVVQADPPEEVVVVPPLEDQAPLLSQPIIPVTALIDDQNLFEVYKCPNSDGKVMICHFPQGTNPPITECIGKTAVSTHFNHSREVIINGVTTTLVDYLGPCR